MTVNVQELSERYAEVTKVARRAFNDAIVQCGGDFTAKRVVDTQKRLSRGVG